jgi:hypothetical protein
MFVLVFCQHLPQCERVDCPESFCFTGVWESPLEAANGVNDGLNQSQVLPDYVPATGRPLTVISSGLWQAVVCKPPGARTSRRQVKLVRPAVHLISGAQAMVK